MTDTEKLREIIRRSGLKHSFIASSLGIGTAALTNKITNRSDFKASEIDALCKLLKIESLEEKEKIFFVMK